MLWSKWIIGGDCEPPQPPPRQESTDLKTVPGLGRGGEGWWRGLAVAGPGNEGGQAAWMGELSACGQKRGVCNLLKPKFAFSRQKSI